LCRQDGASRTISGLYVPDAVIAVKEAVKCESLGALKDRLIEVLSQNSEETRLRNARFVIRWFCADAIDGIARKTWLAYQDARILGGWPAPTMKAGSQVLQLSSRARCSTGT